MSMEREYLLRNRILETKVVLLVLQVPLPKKEYCNNLTPSPLIGRHFSVGSTEASWEARWPDLQSEGEREGTHSLLVEVLAPSGLPPNVLQRNIILY